MPVYAYACKDCGHAFDIRQSFTDDALSECPECDGTLRKQFNTVGVVFKGSGFYRTDSRGSGSSDHGSGSGAGGASGSSDGSGAAGGHGAKGGSGSGSGGGTGNSSSGSGASGSGGGRSS